MDTTKDLEVQILPTGTSELYASGLRLLYHSPYPFCHVECSVTVNHEGKVKISDSVSKEKFLDLMSKLYDMAEVK